MREITQKGLDLIKQFEGFSASIYICPAGYETVGYGHLVLEHERRIFQDAITEAQAEWLLCKDVRVAQRAVLRLINMPLTNGQFDALVSFTYNLGGGALQRSTLRRVINRGHYDEVPRQLKRWIYANGKILKGLVRRREAEIALYCDNAEM